MPRKNQRITSNRTSNKRNRNNKQPVQKRLGKIYGDCRICFKDHPLRNCYKFRRMTVSQRYDVVRNHRYCENCFALSHRISHCKSSERCLNCSQRHHTMLHEYDEAAEVSPPSNIDQTSAVLRRVTILRPTAVVCVKTNGDWVTVRSLINPCEPTSLIAPWMVTKYGLDCEKVGVERICSFSIRSRAQNGYTIKVKARVSKTLPYPVPFDDIDENVASTFSNLILADPNFYKRANVNMILGAEVYQKILQPGLIPGNVGSPVAQNTSLGWTLIGSFGV